MWSEIRQLCLKQIAAGKEFIALPVDQVLALPTVILSAVRALALDGIMAWHDHDLPRMWCVLDQLYGRTPCASLDQFEVPDAAGALETPQPSGPAAGRGYDNISPHP